MMTTERASSGPAVPHYGWRPAIFTYRCHFVIPGSPVWVKNGHALATGICSCPGYPYTGQRCVSNKFRPCRECVAILLVLAWITTRYIKPEVI